MNDRYCPCGTRLDRTSAIRPLKSPCLRMFMSIRTMKCLTSDTKICNSCRMEFVNWKKENSEFEIILNRVEYDMVGGDNFDNNSSDGMDVQVDNGFSSSQAMAIDESSNKVIKNQVVTLSLNSTSSSHKTCCVCRSDLNNNSANVTSDDRDYLFFTRNIWIPEGARCCSQHLIDHQLASEAINEIKPFAIRREELNSSDVQLLLNKSQKLFENKNRRFNFDDPRNLTDDEHRLLTSLSKDDFNEIIQIVSSSSIRNSCNRLIRTAIGIYLSKLHLGLSNRLLACMFELPDKRTVSRIIDSARQAIFKSFVPLNLGFSHMTRQDVINHHTTTIARELMCDGASNTAILVINGTYIYIQKSRNNQFQRKTFNLHKKRSLLKPMMIVTTTGYIVACIGPFFSDFKNNDASMMKDILLRNTDNILNWMEERDVWVVDRGFRDSVAVMQALGLDIAMSPFLDGKRQFSVEEANQARCITKVRWVVEAANRRNIQFKYFANTIQNSSLIYLESDLSIVCALINRYQSPMATSKSEDSEIGQQIMKLLNQKNKIQLLLEENNLIRRPSQWESINHDEILDSFPIMSEDDVGDLTFGVFQLKRARSYAEEKCSTTDLTGTVEYNIQLCKMIPNLIRVPTRSAHIDRRIYYPTIQFTNQQIIGWWCDCPIGGRFIGCCSHISSAIWFLSYERWQTQKRHMPSGSYMDLATDSIQVSDFYDSSDDDDDDSVRYSLS